MISTDANHAYIIQATGTSIAIYSTVDGGAHWLLVKSVSTTVVAGEVFFEWNISANSAPSNLLGGAVNNVLIPGTVDTAMTLTSGALTLYGRDDAQISSHIGQCLAILV